MQKDHPAFALFIVKLSIGHYLAMAPADVHAHHRLGRDLGLDAFDIALIAFAIGDHLGIDVPLDQVDQNTTVEIIVLHVSRAIGNRSAVRSDPPRRALTA